MYLGAGLQSLGSQCTFGVLSVCFCRQWLGQYKSSRAIPVPRVNSPV